MMRALTIWLTASALGAALIAFLPESWLGGGVLFRLSDRHGPSQADGVGLAVVVGSWLFYLHALWRRRGSLRPRWAAWVLAASACLALVGCIIAVAADQDGWAIGLGALALGAQVGLAFIARGALAFDRGRL